MIECVNGGPWDGEVVEQQGDELRIPVTQLPVSITMLTRDRDPSAEPVKEVVHAYQLRRLLDAFVYEYIGDVWR